MAKIVYLLLAHNRPKELVETVQMLCAEGDYVAIHFDRNAPAADFAHIQSQLKDTENVVFARRRRCGWGGWSLVGATLDMLRAAEAQFEDATHFYLISGACAPITPRRQIAKTLDETAKDFIEVEDLERSDWIKTGMKVDRYQYRHFFNERTQPTLFYQSLALQKHFDLKREPPLGLEMKVGSQWWCLRRKTVEAVLDYIKSNPSVLRFFKTTWIPDESFFQSIVSRLVPKSEITGHPPTLLMFTDYGVPVTFHADHGDFLKRQTAFFARKISGTTPQLRQDLLAHYRQGTTKPEYGSDPRKQYKLLAEAGRTGDRFAMRIWDKGMSVPREKDLIIITAKLWHEGEALRQAISERLSIPSVGYLFNTNLPDLPDLGGLQSHVDKLAKHRRAVIKLLFDHYGADRLVICLDPESTVILDDLARDKGNVTVIYVDRLLDEAYFKGHAVRTGQIEDAVSDSDWQAIYRSLRERFERSVGELQHPRLFGYTELRESDAKDRRAERLAAALNCDSAQAAEIIATSQLFKETEHAEL
ncbi:MAG: DUF5928 domain-containing protein [Pseudomonadota bacterium]